MIGKEDIRVKLERRLNSNTWRSLKTSALGRELIEYATNLLFYNSVISETWKRNSYPETSDISGILNLSYALHVPVDVFSPSYVKIKIKGTRVYKPFELKMKFGNISFTNIGYVDENTVCFLYQGIVKTYVDSGDVVDFSYTLRDQITTYKDITGESTHSEYQKLGAYAMSDSVQVFKRKISSVIPVSNWSPLITNKESDIIRIKKGLDNSLNVYWGDGEWGKIKDTSAFYQIIYLESTFEDFEPDGLALYAGDELVEYELMSSDMGKPYDLERAKVMLEAEIARLTAVVSSSQIKAFVKKDSAVLDCKVSAEAGNLIRVYVKPVTVGDEIFDSVEENLTLYGEILSKYKVVPGVPLMFSVILVPLKDIVESQKKEIKSLVESELAYKKLEYSEVISSSRITELVNTNYPGFASGMILLQSTLVTNGEVELQVHPMKGTISLKDGEVVKGWDSEGSIYAFEDDENPITGKIRRLGDFYLSEKDGAKVFDLAMSKFSDNSESFEVANAVEWWEDKNTFIVLLGLPGERVYKIFNKTSVLQDTEFSLQRNYKVPFRESRMIITEKVFSDKDIYVEGTGFYSMESAAGVWSLNRYDIGSTFTKVSNFQVSIGPDTNPCVVSLLIGSDLLILTRDKFTLVSDIRGIPKQQSDDLSTAIELFQANNDKVLWIASGNNASVVIKEEIIEGVGYEVLYRSTPLFVVKELAKVITSQEYVELYRLEKQAQRRLYCVEFDEGVVVYDSFNKQMIDLRSEEPVVLWTDGDTASKLVPIGVVDYEGKTISFKSPKVEGLNVEYVTIDQLTSAGSKYYPVLNTVSWQ